MPRLQLTIPDWLDQILNKTFILRGDKRLFIQKAIELALRNEEFCNIFGCSTHTLQINPPDKINPLNYINVIKPPQNTPSHKLKAEVQQIKFDQEFE